jgi:flagellar biosynthetic protein FliO
MIGKKKIGAASCAACRSLWVLLVLLINIPALAAQQSDPALPAAPGFPPAAYMPSGTSSASSSAPGVDGLSLSWSGYFEALAILFFALALLWTLLWLVKRHGKGALLGGSPTMRVESRLALAPKKWLLVVRCLDRRLVLGLTDDHISLLTEVFIESDPGKTPGLGETPGAAAKKGPAEAPGREEASKDEQLFASLLRGSKENGNPAA